MAKNNLNAGLRANTILGKTPLAGIDINRIVAVSVSSVPTAVPTPNANNIILFTTETPFQDTYRSYVSSKAVIQDCGTNSNASKFANILFQASNNITSAGGVLYIAPMLNSVSATSGTFTTPNILANITNFQTKTDGAFTINIDGSTFDVLNLDFTAINTLQDVANIFQKNLFNVTVAVVNNSITFSSKKFGINSTIVITAQGTGTDITGSDYLNCGSVEPTIGTNSSGETLPEAIARTFHAIQYSGIATDLDLENTALETASAFVNGLTGYYLQNLICNTEDINLLALPNATANQNKARYAIYTNYALRVEAKAGFLTLMAGVNYNANSTAKTSQGKQINGLAPDIIYDSLYPTLETAGCDYYPMVGNNAFAISTGGNGYANNVIDDIALEFYCQYAIFNVLRATNTKIPQTEAGMTMVKNAVAQVLSQFVSNGVIALGTWNSSETFGNTMQFLTDVSTKGWYMYSQPIAQQLQSYREQRIAPTIQIAAKRSGAFHTFSVPVLLEN